MGLKAELAAARTAWEPLTFYQKFEHVSILILSRPDCRHRRVCDLESGAEDHRSASSPAGFDPTDYQVFQAIFGMIFTVIIALEFKRSLLVLAERNKSIVQVRTVILIALLAVVRKLIILDPSSEPMFLFALAATTLALGACYWLVSRAEMR